MVRSPSGKGFEFDRYFDARADMTGKKPSAPFESLDARLKQAREKAKQSANPGPPQGSVRVGLGFAMRIGVELVSALIVGVVIGYFLDQWLGTTPWLMLLFFVLGSAAGIINVYRTVTGLGQTIGYVQQTKDDEGGNDR